MNFLPRSGSLIVPFLIVMLVNQALLYALNKLAAKNYTKKTCRSVGVTVFPKQTNFGSKLLSYFVEAFFDLYMCFILQIYQMYYNNKNLL
jgi:hypothetical protein